MWVKGSKNDKGENCTELKNFMMNEGYEDISVPQGQEELQYNKWNRKEEIRGKG